MNTTLGDRLNSFIQYKKLTKTEFGASFRATRQEVSNWCNGRGLAVNRLADMAQAYPELNIHWLLIGSPHEMLNSKDQSGAIMNEPAPSGDDLIKAAIDILERIKKENSN